MRIGKLVNSLMAQSRLAACVVGAATAITLTAPTAHADPINVWSNWWQPCGQLCIYYSPGLQNGCFKADDDVPDLLAVRFSNCGTGTAGVGQVVGNNGASMGNRTNLCNVTAWYHANYTAPSYAYENWLGPGWSGNFTSTLRNNERSVNINSCV
ncbi:MULTISPECIES: hypothetical protein [Streptomyces]|uniref:hypothetical protein n=1 Tax=Streptomyces TaxID=1883 RepID=UPI0012FEFD63|nr:hypothetical protein [Streptomyces durhamensis]